MCHAFLAKTGKVLLRMQKCEVPQLFLLTTLREASRKRGGVITCCSTLFPRGLAHHCMVANPLRTFRIVSPSLCSSNTLRWGIAPTIFS